jgi:ketosteroid isomerase-like protein
MARGLTCVLGWTLLLGVAALIGQSPAQMSLVEAERAFAKLGTERGVRESFMQWFADEGIGFSPHPHRVKETMAKSPAPQKPPATILRWAPVYGGIALAGDLGWNAGPTVFEPVDGDASKVRHGVFFSVWKRQPDGQWRVVLDLGADTPKPIAALDATFNVVSAPAAGAPPKVARPAAMDSLLGAERQLFAEAGKIDSGAAYRSRLAEYARVHRPGAMPVVGRPALDAWSKGQTTQMTGEVMAGDVSASGDLGYTYGRYHHAGTPDNGYFARVWQKDAAGAWRIVVDTAIPIPPPGQTAGTAPATPPVEPSGPVAQRALKHLQASEWGEAVAAYAEYLGQDPTNAIAWHRLGTSQIFLKKYADAIDSLNRAITVGGSGPTDYYNLGCAHALAGHQSLALDNLEKAVAAGFTDRQQYETDTDLDSLRNTERFQALLKRLK